MRGDYYSRAKAVGVVEDRSAHGAWAARCYRRIRWHSEVAWRGGDSWYSLAWSGVAKAVGDR